LPAEPVPAPHGHEAGLVHRHRSWLQRDYLLASASGVLLALSFPKFGHPAVAWIALTPLLVALAETPRAGFPGSISPGETKQARRSFFLGLTAGAIYFSGTLYWIARVMAVYGDLSGWVAVLINALLVAYLALFPAAFAVVIRRAVVFHGPAALIAAPVVWVATELGRTYLLTGFPWVLLGYSQVSVLPVAQLASIFGVYGVSMLVAMVGTALAWFAVTGRGASGAESTWRFRWRRIAPPVLAVAVVLGVASWGSRRVARSHWTREGDRVRVGLIQGNIEQGQKWDAARGPQVFQEYLRMSRRAIGAGAELVLWPESATPFLFEEDRPAADVVRSLARQARVSILLGSDQIEWRVQAGQRVPDKYFNSAFLVRRDGSVAGSYRKMHLVPFGEYVPLKELLFFAGPLVEAVGPFSAGTDPTLLPVDDHRLSVAICYEVVYPALVRRFVNRGSELLTTITNDAWFGTTSAPHQHFAQAAMRAIEEGRYLVRSANTGISGIVDPYGRVVEKTDIFQPAVLVGEARFLQTSTFYARHGDILAYASLVVTSALIAFSRRSHTIPPCPPSTI
jgi:apolipoprotein N-acyltransferase